MTCGGTACRPLEALLPARQILPHCETDNSPSLRLLVKSPVAGSLAWKLRCGKITFRQRVRSCRARQQSRGGLCGTAKGAQRGVRSKRGFCTGVSDNIFLGILIVNIICFPQKPSGFPQKGLRKSESRKSKIGTGNRTVGVGNWILSGGTRRIEIGRREGR